MRRVNITYRNYFFLVVSICVLSIGCGGGGGSSSTSTSTENHSPSISSVVSSPSSPVNIGTDVTFTCSATDSDGDNLTYQWSANGGTLVQTTGNPIHWTAPDAADSYTITCSVSDGNGGTASSNVIITVASLTNLSVSSINPASGYTDVDTSVQISGSGFQGGATIKIGATSATNVTVVNSTTITATVPYGMTAGTYIVKVTNSDSQYSTLLNGFTVNSPPAEWTKQTLSFAGTPKPLTSTCTILLPDGGTYRMYFTGPGGIWTCTSTDGINWTAPVATGITDTGATNPSVIRLNNGTYLMIYGRQTAMPTTERLYRGTSNDGITFTKQTGPLTGGAVLIADSGENDFVSVPDLIYVNDSTLRMYFVASTINSRVHTATSTDDGVNWTREGQISLSGGQIGGQVNDPDIIKLSDGSYRLFFTTPPAGQSIGDLRIRSAISSDGLTFSVESGSRANPSGSVNALMDPDTVLIIGTAGNYRLYYGGNLTGGGPDDLRVLLSP